MCSKTIAKVWLVVFNSIFFILGAVCLGLGIFVLVDKSRLEALLKVSPGGEIAENFNIPSLLESGAYALIAGGAAVFLIGFLGCCGAIKEVKCFLYIYAVIVGLILVCEIAAGVLAYIYRDTVKTYLKTYMNTTISEKYEGMSLDSSGNIASESSEPFSIAWDFAHIVFKCCGLDNHTDFIQYATKWNNTYTVSSTLPPIIAQVPVSCCKFEDPSKFPGDLANLKFVNLPGCLLSPNSTTAHTTGCYSQVESLILSYSTIVLGVGIGIACIELLGIIAACFLARAISKDDD